jgi:hypothetical protein
MSRMYRVTWLGRALPNLRLWTNPSGRRAGPSHPLAAVVSYLCVRDRLLRWRPACAGRRERPAGDARPHRVVPMCRRRPGPTLQHRGSGTGRSHAGRPRGAHRSGIRSRHVNARERDFDVQHGFSLGVRGRTARAGADMIPTSIVLELSRSTGCAAFLRRRSWYSRKRAWITTQGNQFGMLTSPSRGLACLPQSSASAL